MRHTLASMLLESDTPLPVISDILGHVDTESTAVYLKIDIEKLKECSLDFVELKQSIGYKYIAEAKHLKRFDTFTLEKYSAATALSKEIVLDWCSKKSYEAQANQCTRASIIRQFSRYLDNIGVEAYIMPKVIIQKKDSMCHISIRMKNLNVFLLKRKNAITVLNAHTDT